MKSMVLRSLVIFVSLLALGMVAVSPHYYAHAQDASGGMGAGGCCGGGSVPATTMSLTCGKGTHQVNGQCVADSPSTTSGSNGTSGGTQAPTLNTQGNTQGVHP